MTRWKKKYPANFFFLCRKAMILPHTGRVLFHQSLQFKVFLDTKIVSKYHYKKAFKKGRFFCWWLEFLRNILVRNWYLLEYFRSDFETFVSINSLKNCYIWVCSLCFISPQRKELFKSIGISLKWVILFRKNTLNLVKLKEPIYIYFQRNMKNLPHPFNPNKPYLRPQFNSSFVSVKSSTPWKVIEKFSIFTSRDCSWDAKTPVHERFDKSNFTPAPFSVPFELSTPFSVAWTAGFGFPLDWAAAFFFAWRFFAASEGIFVCFDSGLLKENSVISSHECKQKFFTIAP